MLGAHRRLLQDMVTNESALVLEPDRLHAFPPENEGAVDGPLEPIMQSDLAVGAAMRGKQIGLTTITDPAVRGHALMVVCEDGDRQPVFLVVHYCSTASAPSQAAAELPCGSSILVKEPRLRAFPLGPVVCCSNPANVFFPSLPLPEPSPMVDSVDQLLSDARYRDAARELMARKELARMRAVLQRAREFEEGRYDFVDLYSAHLAHERAVCADYTSARVEVRLAGAAGLGVFATADLSPGELVMGCNAVAYISTRELSVRKDTRPTQPRVLRPTQPLVLRRLQRRAQCVVCLLHAYDLVRCRVSVACWTGPAARARSRMGG